MGKMRPLRCMTCGEAYEVHRSRFWWFWRFAAALTRYILPELSWQLWCRGMRVTRWHPHEVPGGS
jgi:hypothetical protein